MVPRMCGVAPAKQFKTHAEQIALLRERGMAIPSDDDARYLLERVNYYRLVTEPRFLLVTVTALWCIGNGGW